MVTFLLLALATLFWGFYPVYSKRQEAFAIAMWLASVIAIVFMRVII